MVVYASCCIYYTNYVNGCARVCDAFSARVLCELYRVVLPMSWFHCSPDSKSSWPWGEILCVWSFFLFFIFTTFAGALRLCLSVDLSCLVCWCFVWALILSCLVCGCFVWVICLSVDLSCLVCGCFVWVGVVFCLEGRESSLWNLLLRSEHCVLFPEWCVWDLVCAAVVVRIIVPLMLFRCQCYLDFSDCILLVFWQDEHLLWSNLCVIACWLKIWLKHRHSLYHEE